MTQKLVLKQSLTCKSNIIKKKEYSFFFSDEDIEKGKNATFDNPHFCKQDGLDSLSQYALFMDDRGLTIRCYLSYVEFRP